MILAVIQARLGSTRFPGKTFASLSGRPLIWHVVDRLKHAEKIDQIVIATTINPLDDELEAWATSHDIPVFRGSENNVLERFYMAARHFSADIIVRITADDPFKDPILIDGVINKLLTENLDFVCNNNPPSFPEGLDTEVFTFQALEMAYLNSSSDFEKEHVTQYFYKNPQKFKHANLAHVENLSWLRWTIDTEKDYRMVSKIYDLLYNDTKIFHFQDILNLIHKHPEIPVMNSDVPRSTMYK